MSSVPSSPRFTPAPFACPICNGPMHLYDWELYCPDCVAYRPTYALTDNDVDWLNDLLREVYGDE